MCIFHSCKMWSFFPDHIFECIFSFFHFFRSTIDNYPSKLIDKRWYNVWHFKRSFFSHFLIFYHGEWQNNNQKYDASNWQWILFRSSFSAPFVLFFLCTCYGSISVLWSNITILLYISRSFFVLLVFGCFLFFLFCCVSILRQSRQWHWIWLENFRHCKGHKRFFSASFHFPLYNVSVIFHSIENEQRNGK